MSDVYRVVYPRAFSSVASKIFSPLRGDAFGWVRGLNIHCLQLHLTDELALFTLLPFALVVLVLALSWSLRGTAVPTLPFVLRITYLVWPIISSRGFQGLAHCDCFEPLPEGVNTNATEQLCFLASSGYTRRRV